MNKENKTIISIVTPCYNSEKYVEKTIQSVISQTFRDFEFIIVDGGSVDNTIKIIEKYSSADERIKLIKSDAKYQGITKNLGIDSAQGEYLTFLDSDDLLEENALQILYDKINNTDIDYIHFDYYNVYENEPDEVVSFEDVAREHLKTKIKDGLIYNWHDINDFSFVYIQTIAWNRIYSLKFIKENNIKFAPTRYYEDDVFTISAALKAKKVQYFKIPLNRHLKIREGSIMNALSDIRYTALDAVKIIEKLLKLPEYKTLRKKFKKHTTGLACFLYDMSTEKGKKELYKKAKETLSRKEFKKFERQCYKEEAFSFFGIKFFKFKDKK